MLPIFEDLWAEIDETEFLVTTYELKEGKRKLPVRQELCARLSAPVQSALRARAESLAPYAYLKLKHHLVELRRE